MKWVCALLLISSELFAIEDFKKIIIDKKQALESSISEEKKSQLFFELAIAYYHDQEIDQAFKHFLEALKRKKQNHQIQMSPLEAGLYQEALEDYLMLSGSNPSLAGEQLLEKYEEVANRHPEFIHLNFLISTASANLEKYQDFFEKFYRGYSFLHDTFLAYKIQGILSLRLAHHGITVEERQLFQNDAFHYLNLALDKNPKDPGLYKTLFFLAKEENNYSLILSYLSGIIKNHVCLPRSDILFYVKEAVEIKAFELGQEIIDQAKARYTYSRSILAAQNYLNQHKG